MLVSLNHISLRNRGKNNEGVLTYLVEKLCMYDDSYEITDIYRKKILSN